MKKYTYLVCLLLSAITYSQVGINTEIPAATLDVVGQPADPLKLDGIIAPRLKGDELSLKNYTSAQTGAMVYATNGANSPSPQTVNVTGAGYYYFNGTVWVKTSGSGGASGTEPWFDQATDTEATANTQDIYQMGNVAVGKTDNLAGTALDVEGAVHGGTGHTGTVGANSATFGQNNTNAGASSLVVGIGNISNVSNEYGFISGEENYIYGQHSSAIGYSNAINKNNSFAIGVQNILEGSHNYTLGLNLTTLSPYQIAIGRYNAIRTVGSTGFDANADDPVFQVGVGSVAIHGVGNGNVNAMTILHNMHTGIGIYGTEAAAKPTEMLDIGSGNVRVRDINSNAGAATDKYVVADANGVLKTVTGSPTTAPMNVTYQTGSYTALPTDDIILYTSNTVGVTLTLPTTGVTVGKKIYVSNNGSQNVDLTPLPRETQNQYLSPSTGMTLLYTGDATSPWSVIVGF